MVGFERWKERVRQLKRDTYAIYLAYRDPRVPWYAKILIALIVAHTFSPIDLIPDFIPILGYLDDLIIAPLGIALALKMIPQDVMAENREKAEAMMEQDEPTSWVAAVVIVAIWLLIVALATVVAWRGELYHQDGLPNNFDDVLYGRGGDSWSASFPVVGCRSQESRPATSSTVTAAILTQRPLLCVWSGRKLASKSLHRPSLPRIW